MDYNKLKIQKFNLNNVVSNSHIAIIGKRGSGKKILVNDILQNLNKKNAEIIIVSPLERMNSFYKLKCPLAKIKYELTDELLLDILTLGEKEEKIVCDKEINTSDGELIMLNESSDDSINPDYNKIVVFDDCLCGKKSWLKNENFLEILMNGRHYGITYIITMQYPYINVPDIRLNFDYVMLFEEHSISIKKNYGMIMYLLFLHLLCSIKYSKNAVKNMAH